MSRSLWPVRWLQPRARAACAQLWLLTMAACASGPWDCGVPGPWQSSSNTDVTFTVESAEATTCPGSNAPPDGGTCQPDCARLCAARQQPEGTCSISDPVADGGPFTLVCNTTGVCD